MATGKISRLPREIREQVNRKLDDGEPGNRLVVWLRAVKEKPWPFGWEKRGRSFWVLASSRLSHPDASGLFAKASPKPKNSRSERPRFLFNRSNELPAAARQWPEGKAPVAAFRLWQERKGWEIWLN